MAEDAMVALTENITNKILYYDYFFQFFYHNVSSIVITFHLFFHINMNFIYIVYFSLQILNKSGTKIKVRSVQVEELD